MSEKLFYVGVKALIKNKQDQILLFQADVSHDHQIPTDPYWDLAGGRIEEGEDALATLKREVMEEAGLTLQTASFKTAVISHHELLLDNGKRAGLVLMIYEVTVKDPEQITLSPEHTTYAWLEIADAKQKLAHKYPQEFTNLL